eukprot:PhF_6_TR26556/c0_g1_i2/m.38415
MVPVIILLFVCLGRAQTVAWFKYQSSETPQVATLPTGTRTICFVGVGGSGGGSNAEGKQFPGGSGGQMSGCYSVTPGALVEVIVGAGGGMSSYTGEGQRSAYPGGGKAGTRVGYYMGAGGGCTILKVNGKLIAVAPGGGGAGGTGFGSSLTTQGGSGCSGNGSSSSLTQNCGGRGGYSGPPMICPYNGVNISSGGYLQGGHGGSFEAGTGNADGGGGCGYVGGQAGALHTGGGSGSCYCVGVLCTFNAATTYDGFRFGLGNIGSSGEQGHAIITYSSSQLANANPPSTTPAPTPAPSTTPAP